MKRIAGLLVIAAVTFGVVSLKAQQKTVKLEHKLKKGQKLMVNDVHQVRGWGRFGDDFFDFEIDQSGTGTLEVLSVDDNGNLEIRRSWKVTATERKLQQTETGELAPLTFVFSKTGQLLENRIEPFEATQEKLMNPRNIFEYILRQFAEVLQFPENEVSVGNAWKTSQKFRMPDGKEVTATGTATLFALQGNTAWIRTEVKLPLEFKFGPDLANYGWSGAMVSRSMWQFDVEKGHPVKSIEWIDFDMTAELEPGGNKIQIVFFGTARGEATMTVQ